MTHRTASRRAFLAGSLAASGALAAGEAAAQGAPADAPIHDGPLPYGAPAPGEAHVARRGPPPSARPTWSTLSYTPLHALDGVITPNGLCFTRHHGAAPQIDLAEHKLMVHGMVRQPLVFTMQDLARFPRENRVHVLECGANTASEWRGPRFEGVQHTHGLIHNVMYTGVRLRHLLEEAGLRGDAGWLLAESADGFRMSRSLPIEKALDDCLVAFKMNGESLRPEQGYPLRLVVPGWEGAAWVKWLRRLEIGDTPWHSRDESVLHADPLADGRVRRFTWAMDAKSVITAPSPEAPVSHGPGRLVISGLAWSGRGTVPRVDVSIDGGRNWAEARLSGPDLEKALRRFYLDIVWDGGEMVLQSRAHCSTGYVQPTRAMLRAVRGDASRYHNNGVQSWRVRPDGTVDNVEIA